MDRDSNSEVWKRNPPAPSVLDYAAWARKPHWSVNEAAKIVCGRDPDAKIPRPQTYNQKLRVIDIIDQAFAATQQGSLKVMRGALLPIHVLVDPATFLRWALENGLAVPDPLLGLVDLEPAAAKELSDAFLRERVITIARTLWFLEPKLTPTQIAYHGAMLAIVTDIEVNMSDRLLWIGEAGVSHSV